MKNTYKILTLIIVLSAFNNCSNNPQSATESETPSNITLTKNDCKKILTNKMTLPVTNYLIVGKKYMEMSLYKQDDANKLIKKGYLAMTSDYPDTRLYITDLGKQYLVSESEESIKFKTCEFNIEDVAEIIYNNERQTANVKFIVSTANVTPIGNVLGISESKSQCSCHIRKINNNWELESSDPKAIIEKCLKN